MSLENPTNSSARRLDDGLGCEGCEFEGACLGFLRWKFCNILYFEIQMKMGSMAKKGRRWVRWGREFVKGLVLGLWEIVMGFKLLILIFLKYFLFDVKIALSGKAITIYIPLH